jgi:gliding motility-associated-like protein
MNRLFAIFLFLLPFTLIAQTERGLIAHYLFEGNLNDNRGNTDNMGISLDDPTFGCCILGQSLSFNGGSDEVRFTGQVRQEFNNTEDFTLSFYFKPRTLNGTQYLISKRRTNCELENAFFIRYQPASSTLNVYLRERDGRIINLVESLSSTVCWHHVVVTRDGGVVRLYVDGTFRQEQATIGRIDLLNDVDLILGSSDCFGQNELPFNGLMDEMRVYNIALEDNEIRDLYLAPDRILSRDTVIFLGSTVPIEINHNCTATFSWAPALGVNPPTSSNPIIQPLNQGDFIYRVRIADAESFCVAEDSIRITVVDPTTLDCSEVFLPNTFTPNDDGLNDTYGISNPFAINLTALEIFDRWGARVFASSDPFRKWDGTFKNEPVMPGVFKYRVRYECNGEEREAFGTLTVMR